MAYTKNHSHSLWLSCKYRNSAFVTCLEGSPIHKLSLKPWGSAMMRSRIMVPLVKRRFWSTGQPEGLGKSIFGFEKGVESLRSREGKA